MELVMDPGILENDYIIPDYVDSSQFFKNNGYSIKGEKGLMIAIMEATFEDLQGASRSNRSRRLFNEAVAYIENQDRSWPYSFENICETLGLNTESVRKEARKHYFN